MTDKIEELEIYPAAGSALPALPLRFSCLLQGIGEAATEAAEREARVPQLFRHAGGPAARYGDFSAGDQLSHRSGQRDVSRSVLLPGAARTGGAASSNLSVAEGMGRRLQQRRRTLFAGDPVPRGGAGAAHDVLRHRHQPRRAGRCRQPASTTSTAFVALPRTTSNRAAAPRFPTTTPRPTAKPRSIARCASGSFSPTTAW